MDHYHVWVNLKDTTKDVEFAAAVERYLGHLRKGGLIEGFSVARRKLGLGPRELGEFHVTIHVQDLSQLDRAFTAVAARSGVVEDFHHAVYDRVTDFTSLLERDFPDPVRRPAGPD